MFYSSTSVLAKIMFIIFKSHVNHDIGAIINMGALTISQLLENAQEKGVDLELDTANCENQANTLLLRINTLTQIFCQYNE